MLKPSGTPLGFFIYLLRSYNVHKFEDEVEDKATADMLIAVRQSVEKQSWMFRSFLGK